MDDTTSGALRRKYFSSQYPNAASFAADAAIDASNSLLRTTDPDSFAASAVIFSARSVGGSHADYIWNAVWSDTRAMESIAPNKLAVRPLWAHGIPAWMNHYWLSLKQNLLASPDHWEVWTDWYHSRLEGDKRESPNEQLEIARAGIAETIWSQSPRAVNAYVKQIVAAHSPKGPPSEPPAGPGPKFALTPNGFEIVPSPPAIGEREDPTQISLHRQLNRRVERLSQVVSRIQNTHKPLFDEYNDYSTFIEADLARVDVPSLWSAGAALNDMVEAFAHSEGTTSLTMSERLEPDILSQLRSLLRDHTTFIMGFEQGQELAARAAALRALDVKVGELALRSRRILDPMLRTKSLLAENARILVQTISRTLDVVDEKTLAVVGAAVEVGTRSVVAFGRAIAPFVGPAAIVASLTGVNLSTAMGDANAETLRAALTYLSQNANALAAFASHDAQLKLWLDWLISEIRRNTPSEKSH